MKGELSWQVEQEQHLKELLTELAGSFADMELAEAVRLMRESAWVDVLCKCLCVEKVAAAAAQAADYVNSPF